MFSDDQIKEHLAPLIAQPHWLVWKFKTTKTGKPTKVPYQARYPKKKAATDNPDTWATYDEAVAAAKAHSFDGIGFALKDTEISAFDIDHCRNPETGTIEKWAADLVARANSYTEITPSSTGLRILGTGAGAETHCKLTVPNANGTSCEVYRKAIRYITVSGNIYLDAPLADLDKAIDEVLAELCKEQPKKEKPKGTHGEIDDVEDLIKNGERGQYDGDRSKAVWRVICELFRQGRYAPYIEKVLLDKANGISEHIFDQPSPEAYTKRQVARAKESLTFVLDDDEEDKKPISDRGNICIALLKMGVTITHDDFADRMLIAGLRDFGPAIDDAAVIRLRFTMQRLFKLSPQKGFLFDVITDVARLNSFHPVRDYLDSITWDGVPRLDRWLITYAGALDTEYVRAVGALVLTAAVRRVRQPGCKFDEMLILESPIQGKDKSTALSVLAKNDDWFADDLPLGAIGRVVIEQTRGRWIVEAAELSGMRKADIEKLKAHLSRRIDRGRMSYDRLGIEAPRQHIVIGTTNSDKYLLDTTGNRRYWPVKAGTVDIEKLTLDRDQLWAEAAHREASGASIRLAKELWGAAAEQQAEREVDDPYFDTLSFWLGDREGKIAAQTVWTILDAKSGNLGQHHNMRMGEALRKLGWKRPNTAKTIKIGSHNVSGYIKGEPPLTLISAEWIFDKDNGTRDLIITEGDDEPAPPVTLIASVTEVDEKKDEYKVQLDDEKEFWLPNVIERIPIDGGKFKIVMPARLAKKYGVDPM